MNPWIRKISKETRRPEKEIEPLWKEAKKIAEDTFGVKEEKFGKKHYQFVVDTVKSMLGLKEDFSCINFIKSEKSAKEFIEEVTSKSFTSLDKTVIMKKNKKDKKDEEKEESSCKKKEEVKEEKNNKTKPCPICKTEVLENTGYCVKCEKKVF